MHSFTQEPVNKIYIYICKYINGVNMVIIKYIDMKKVLISLNVHGDSLSTLY